MSRAGGTQTESETFFTSSRLPAGFGDRYRTFEANWLSAGGKVDHSSKQCRWVFVNALADEHFPLNVRLDKVNVMRPSDAKLAQVSDDAYARYRAAIDRVPAFLNVLSRNRTVVWNELITPEGLQVLLDATLALLPDWHAIESTHQSPRLA